MSSQILDLKNPKNHKKNNNHSVSDVLNGEESKEPELELVPIEPAKKPVPVEPAVPEKKEEPLDDFLKNLDQVDIKDEIQDNPGIMADQAALPATFTTAIPQSRRMSGAEPSTSSLSWTAPDKHHELISHAWRKAIIVILAGMAFLALFWQGSILTAITFFGLALVTSMHFWREPREEQHEIHPHGIVVGGRFYHYHDFDSFWIHYHPEGHHELSLCTGKLIDHYIKVPLAGQNPFEVRDALLMYLPEEKHEEGIEDLLRRKLGL